MRQKLYNQKERFINISDNVGLHIFKDEVGYVDGIYNVTNKQAELVYDFVSTKDFYEILNGSNYVMVYGVGTPEENAAELQAAYDAAKNMPRYLGEIDPLVESTYYAGQTLKVQGVDIYIRMNSDFVGAIDNAIDTTPVMVNSAISTRTTVIVAPGEYNFGTSAFVVDTPGINIVSLTGNSDVIISSTEVNPEYNYTYGIKVHTDFTLIKGINCKINTFYIADNLDNLICEYCIGGDFSFGGGLGCTASGTFNFCTGGDESFGGGMNCTASGTFNFCTGGDYSFGSGMDCTASGTFTNCTGGKYSFGNSAVDAILSGKLINCKLTAESFGTPTGKGKIYNSIDGNGNLINTPLPIFANNDAAASLAVGTMYRTATGVQMIKY